MLATALAALLCAAAPAPGVTAGAPPRAAGGEDAGFTRPRATDPDCIRRRLAEALAAQPDLPPPGRVLQVKFLVPQGGVPSRLEFPEGRPPEPLASIVQAAVRGCRFEPARRPDGAAVNVWVSLPLRLEAPPPPSVAPWLWLAAAVYAAFVVAWVVLSRWLGLSGRRAPPRDTLPRPDYLTRRSTRALLAFDFLLVLPLGGLGLVVAVLGRHGEVLLALLSSLVFLLPLPFLLRKIRADDRRRAAGLPPPTPAAQMSFGHAGFDALLAGPARATQATLVVVAITSVAALLFPDQLLLWLRKDDQAVRAGEVWRLLTVGLVHANFLHLAFNLSALHQVGRLLERLAGTRAYLLVLLASVVSGGVASVLSIEAPSVGISGGVFGLMGALAVFGWRQRAALPAGAHRGITVAAAQSLAINLAITFTLPFIDWAAHLGGLAAGAAMGWWLPPSAALAEVLAERTPSPGALPPPPPPPLPPTA